MTTVDRIKDICKERKIPIAKLERDCGFGNAYIRRLREGMLPADRLYKIAEYLGVSPDYLLTGQESEHESATGKKYYFSDETAEAAQEIFDDPDLHALFSAAQDSKPENVRFVTEMLLKLKATNPEG